MKTKKTSKRAKRSKAKRVPAALRPVMRRIPELNAGGRASRLELFGFGRRSVDEPVLSRPDGVRVQWVA